MSPLRRLIVAACWLAIATAYVAALLPQHEAPSLGASDKVDHMAAFFTISILARLGYRHLPVWRIVALAAVFGAFIEVSQMVPALHRDAEISDWVADVIATALGVLAAWPLLAWWDRRQRGTH